MLHATIITLFPDMFPGPLGYSLVGRALEEGKWSLSTINLRDFGVGKHKNVDDTPYGGGAGMVLRPDVVDAALKASLREHPEAQIIYFTPKGRVMNQKLLGEINTNCYPVSPKTTSGSGSQRSKAGRDNTINLILLCGRFEAIDQRIIDKYQPLEVSLGDFVMTGGEIAAMALLDTAVRLLPGVVGEADSLAEESFGLNQDYACLLEYPHYTAPPNWDRRAVPEVLTSGNHGAIAKWRKTQAEQITRQRRPDLWKRYTANKD